MSKAPVPHRLVSVHGTVLRASVLFGAGVHWQPSEIVTLSPQERYRVLERRDGNPVTLVVEPAPLKPPDSHPHRLRRA